MSEEKERKDIISVCRCCRKEIFYNEQTRGGRCSHCGEFFYEEKQKDAEFILKMRSQPIIHFWVKEACERLEAANVRIRELLTPVPVTLKAWHEEQLAQKDAEIAELKTHLVTCYRYFQGFYPGPRADDVSRLLQKLMDQFGITGTGSKEK